MTSHSVEIKNIKGLSELKVTFDFLNKDVVIVTGKNGSGKTTLIKAFRLLSDLQVFNKTSNGNSIRDDSSIEFNLDLDGFQHLLFSYNSKLKALDTKQALPPKDSVISELPIPFGYRFQHLSLVSKYDSEVRTNFITGNYTPADRLQSFLGHIYAGSEKFSELNETNVGKYTFYFIPLPNDYYLREDHLSSGEYFLIQLYRLITSGSKLVVIDELDISLDAAAQVRFLDAAKLLLKEYDSKLIMISHSLALMETANEGDIYYLEKQGTNVSLEQRSFGYVKSDLYGFKGRDRYILTEDPVLVGFIEYLIQANEIKAFFNYEIIPVGGEPQVRNMAERNDQHEIFGPSEAVMVVIDRDIFAELNSHYKGPTLVFSSPVDDIEVYIWRNKEKFLPDVPTPDFTHATTTRRNAEKKTAKTYWNKIINSQRSPELKKQFTNRLYKIVTDNNCTDHLIQALRKHLQL